MKCTNQNRCDHALRQSDVPAEDVCVVEHSPVEGEHEQLPLCPC